MLKHITLLLFFSLFFNACAERGYTPKPLSTTSISINKSHKPISLKKIQNSTENITIIKTKENTKKEKSFFGINEDTKNTVSGFFILVIGVIILL